MTRDKKKALEALMASVTEVMEACGIDKEAAVKAMSKAYKGKDTHIAERNESLEFSEAMLLGTLLHLWRSEPEFVGIDGGPAELKEKGEGKSFERLFERAIEDHGEAPKGFSGDRALKVLTESGSVSKTKTGIRQETIEFRPTGGMGGAFLNLVTLAEFATTIARNTAADASVRASHVSRVTHFPEEEVEEMNSMVKSRGLAFLQELDEILESSKSRGEEAEGGKTVGVGFYFFDYD